MPIAFDVVNTVNKVSCPEKKVEYTIKERVPYYCDTEKNIELYNEDSLHFLKKIPDRSVDMIFADPPYFGNQSGLIIKRRDGHAESFSTQKAKFAYSKSLQYQFEFHHTWLKEAQRILKDGSTVWITGTYHSIGVVNVVLQDLGFKILNDIILHKRNAPPNFTGSCFRAVTETMLWAKKNLNGRTKFNYWAMKELNGGFQMKSLWEYWAEKNPFRHPATKQPIILEYAILAGSNKGDVILDPFAGSGTTGFVAQGLGRKCIMVEVDTGYCELIKNRIEGKYGGFKRKTGTKRNISKAAS